MFEILFPLPFLVIGICATFFRDRAAEWFCRFGKAIWRGTTFGLFDAARFYREEDARKVFRLLGPVFLCVGLILAWVSVQSFSGPGTFAAMREARLHLERAHGSSTTWKVSASPADADGVVIVTYRYGTRNGELIATWKDDHYEFSEKSVEKK